MTSLSKHGADNKGLNIKKHSKSKGCPPYALIHDYYNKLRYFSSNRCFNEGADDMPDSEACGTITKDRGVIGDGGMISTSTLINATQDKAQRFNTAYQYGVSGRRYPCTENFLCLSNGREVLEAAASPTLVQTKWLLRDYCKPCLQHLYLDNSTIDSVSDKRQLYLYKKGHTEDITNPATEVTKIETGDLMEFIYLSITTKPCQKGAIFLELFNLEITGNSSDGLLYVYVMDELTEPASAAYADNRWPGRKDLAWQLETPSENYFGDDFNLTDMNTTASAVLKISDLTSSQGIGKKTILNTGYLADYKSKVVRVIIGLKPAEIDHSKEYVNTFSAVDGYNYAAVTQSYDNNITMSYTSIKARVERFSTAFSTAPLYGLCEGFKNLTNNHSYVYPMLTMALTADGEAAQTVGNSGYFGYPNGGSFKALSVLQMRPGSIGETAPSGQKIYSIRRGSKIVSNGLMYCLNIGLVERSGTYIVRLPRFEGAWSGKVSSYDTDFNLVESYSSSTSKLILYSSAYLLSPYEVNESPGQMKDFAEDLTVLKEWTFAEVYSQQRNLYDKDAGPAGIPAQTGAPTFLLNADTNLLSDWLYHSIDMSAVAAGNLYLYLGIETNGIAPHDIASSEGALHSTTSRIPEYIYDDLADVSIEPLTSAYLMPSYLYMHDNSYNYGIMAFKSPQILDFNELPEPEKYLA